MDNCLIERMEYVSTKIRCQKPSCKKVGMYRFKAPKLSKYPGHKYRVEFYCTEHMQEAKEHYEKQKN